MMHNALQNIICMTLKQGDIVILLTDNINNVHYKLELNIYIGSYIIMFLISGVDPCGWVFEEKYYEWWYYGYFGVGCLLFWFPSLVIYAKGLWVWHYYLPLHTPDYLFSNVAHEISISVGLIVMMFRYVSFKRDDWFTTMIYYYNVRFTCGREDGACTSGAT